MPDPARWIPAQQAVFERREIDMIVEQEAAEEGGEAEEKTEGDRCEEASRSPSLLAPAQVCPDCRERRRDGHQGVPVRDPAGGGRMRLIQRQEEQGDGPCRARQCAPENEPRREESEEPPGERVDVIAERAPAEEGEVGADEQVRERPEEGDLEPVVDPPREPALPRQVRGACRITIEEAEEGRRWIRWIPAQQAVFERREIDMIVEQEAAEEGGEAEEKTEGDRNEVESPEAAPA
jgi:hypothetical protein